MNEPLPARWFDGRSPQAQDCELSWQGQQLELRLQGQISRRYAASRVQWPERTRHGRRQIQLPDGGVIDLPDAQAWDRWAQAHGLQQPLAVRWAASWRLALLSLLLLLGSGLALWRWGIPAAADGAVRVMPPSWEQRIGQQAFDEVERSWLKASKLKADEVRAIESAVDAMVRRAYPDDTAPVYRLHLRDGGKLIGPNAFALPGGDIVVTDALVELLRDARGAATPALLGVVAHELGHVRQRHGLRMLVKAGLVGLFTGLWIGDYSSLLATVPAWLAQADYSRDAEREADAEALRVMRAAGIAPREMLRFFEKLRQSLPQRDGDAGWLGLASHPPDSERVRFFEQG